MENAPLRSESSSETEDDEDAEERPFFRLLKFEGPTDEDEKPTIEAPALPPLELITSEKEDKASSAEQATIIPADKKAAEIPKQATRELPADASFEDQVEAVAAETPEALEAEAPTEEVGEAEKAVIEPELVAMNRELEADEPADDDVERFRDLIVVEGKDSETAYQEVMSELGVEEDHETEEDLFSLGLEEETPETSIEDEDTVLTVDHAEGDDEFNFEVEHSQAEDDKEDDPLANAASTTAKATTTTANTGTSGSGGTGSGGPGGGPFSGGPGGPPPPHGGAFGGPGAPGGPGGGTGFNTAPAAPALATPNRLTSPIDLQERRGAHPATMALFGGIVGYLVGRRRGRIKAEKRLLPVQKKLEKQVDDLQWQLHEKEERIRQAAAAKAKRESTMQPTTAEAPNSHLTKEVQADTTHESVSDARPERPQLVTERQRAPEAHQLHGSEKASEHIGQVLIAAETPVAPVRRHEIINQKIEQAKQVDIRKVGEQAPELQSQKRVETMTRAELLSMSEKIVVDGSSLRQIYETHLIGERGLRRLVAEHLRGGDIKKALKQEVVEREIDFERDPVLRDMAQPTSDSGGGPAGGAAALNHMIEKAAASVGGNNEELAYYKARTNYQSEQHKQQLRRQRAMDMSVVGVIVGLITIIAIVFFTRGG